jgi:lipid-binding SYLF domain-containing protein
VSLDGAALTMDDSANAKVYGKAVDGEDILLEKAVKVNSTVKPFVDALEKHSSARKQTTRE